MLEVEEFRIKPSVEVDEALLFYVCFVGASAFRLDVESRAKAHAVEAQEPALKSPVVHAVCAGLGDVLAESPFGVRALADGW